MAAPVPVPFPGDDGARAADAPTSDRLLAAAYELLTARGHRATTTLAAAGAGTNGLDAEALGLPRPDLAETLRVMRAANAGYATRWPGPRPAAVLWDMDGTLVDTEPYWMRAATELVAAHGGTWTEEDARTVVGFDLLDAAAHLQRVGGVDMDPVAIVELMMDRVVEQMADSPPWQPGALELLTALRDEGIPCVLVTMSWRRLAETIVDLLPPGTFAGAVVGDEVPRGKPHPDPYLAAARLVGVEPGACIALEDSPTGARSARAAGCRVLAVPHVVDVPADLVDAVVPSLTAVDVAMLRRLAGA